MGRWVPVTQIGEHWKQALVSPISPVEVNESRCHEVVYEGVDLNTEGNGLDALPVPISTPGFDVAPYLTATSCISRDPETGVPNIGTYRGVIKALTRMGLKMFVN